MFGLEFQGLRELLLIHDQLGCRAVGLALVPSKRAGRAKIFPMGTWEPVKLVGELELAPLAFSPVANQDDVSLKMCLVHTYFRDLCKYATAPRK